MATLGCIVVGILIACFFEIGNSHIQNKLLSKSYFESFTTVSIVMFATALLKGNYNYVTSNEGFYVELQPNLNT